MLRRAFNENNRQFVFHIIELRFLVFFRRSNFVSLEERFLYSSRVVTPVLQLKLAGKTNTDKRFHVVERKTNKVNSCEA